MHGQFRRDCVDPSWTDGSGKIEMTHLCERQVITVQDPFIGVPKRAPILHRSKCGTVFDAFDELSAGVGENVSTGRDKHACGSDNSEGLEHGSVMGVVGGGASRSGDVGAQRDR